MPVWERQIKHRFKKNPTDETEINHQCQCGKVVTVLEGENKTGFKFRKVLM